MNAGEYRDQLRTLAPSGDAWAIAEGSMLDRLLLAWSDGFAAFDARLLELLEESDPRTTTELVAAWERVAGLPDECVPESPFIEDRRAAIWQKLTGVGGQSIAYYQSVAARLSSEISIQEFPTFHAGSPCGMPVYGAAWKYVWQVTIISSPDEPGVLECVLSRLAPAHTVVYFAYAEGVFPSFFFDFTVGF